MSATPAVSTSRSTTPQGFVDVGAFAREPVPAVAVAGRSEYLEWRRWLDLPAAAVSVAAATLRAGGEAGLVVPGEEFVLVREGSLVLHQGGAEIALAAGEQAMLLRGVPFAWSSGTGAQLVILRCTGGGQPPLMQPVRIDTDPVLAPSNAPLAELLVGPTPQCRSHASYRSPSGEFVCGTWDSTPYQRLPMTFQHFELMHLLAGRVSFEDSLGRSGTFGPGDVVLFVRGGTAAWDSREYVRKVYAWFRPA